MIGKKKKSDGRPRIEKSIGTASHRTANRQTPTNSRRSNERSFQGFPHTTDLKTSFQTV